MKERVSVEINGMLLDQIQRYAAAHGLSLDFVLGVAIDQFLSDPANEVQQVLAHGAGAPAT